jgi:hypothetical protein
MGPATKTRYPPFHARREASRNFSVKYIKVKPLAFDIKPARPRVQNLFLIVLIIDCQKMLYFLISRQAAKKRRAATLIILSTFARSVRLVFKYNSYHSIPFNLQLSLRFLQSNDLKLFTNDATQSTFSNR